MLVMPRAARVSRHGRRLSQRRDAYLSPLTERSIETIGPSLFPTNHPQNKSIYIAGYCFARKIFRCTVFFVSLMSKNPKLSTCEIYSKWRSRLTIQLWPNLLMCNIGKNRDCSIGLTNSEGCGDGVRSRLGFCHFCGILFLLVIIWVFFAISKVISDLS